MASGQDSTPGAQTLLSHHHRVVDQALHGTIDEIIGDALLVIFGAPQALPDWAQRAVARAIEVQNAMAKVNAQSVAAPAAARDGHFTENEAAGDHGEVYFVSLTSVPTEIVAYFRTHLALR